MNKTADHRNITKGKRTAGKLTHKLAPDPKEESTTNKRTREVTPSSKSELCRTTQEDPPSYRAPRRNCTPLGSMNGEENNTYFPSVSIRTPPRDSQLDSDQAAMDQLPQTRRHEHPTTAQRLKSQTHGDQPMGQNSVSTSTSHPRSNQRSAQPWSITKRDQSRRQQRAFSNKGDNPFAIYSHDPNDAESRLTSLSAKVSQSEQESVIPKSRLRQLDAAYRHMERGRVHLRSSDGPIPRLHSRRLSTPREQPATSVLAQKAAEQNQFISDTEPAFQHRTTPIHGHLPPGFVPPSVAMTPYLNQRQETGPHLLQTESHSPYGTMSYSRDVPIQQSTIEARAFPNDPYYQKETGIPWGAPAPHGQDAHFRRPGEHTQVIRTNVSSPYLLEEKPYYIPEVGRPVPSVCVQPSWSQPAETWDVENHVQQHAPQVHAGIINQHQSERIPTDSLQGAVRPCDDWNTAFF